MIWRVGCYKINPTTPSGQKFFILHMLVLPLIPITALVIQNGENVRSGQISESLTVMARSHHELSDGLLGPGLHHQEAGQGSHGDRGLHPEHPGGESRGGSLHLPQQFQCHLLLLQILHDPSGEKIMIGFPSLHLFSFQFSDFLHYFFGKNLQCSILI